MSSTTKSTTNWRQREVEKARRNAEAATAAAHAAERKKIENTESNFPTLVAVARSMTVPLPNYSEKVEELRARDEREQQIAAYRNDLAVREERTAVNTNRGVFLHSRKRTLSVASEDYEPVMKAPRLRMSQLYPGHGRRGTYLPPDAEGWRLVATKGRKQKRELTHAELVAKYSEYDDDEATHHDFNGELTDSNDRRAFY